MSDGRLTHLDAEGRAAMVDVGDKPATSRTATAAATIRMRPETLAAILSGAMPKGDVLATARIAGIMAAKQTASLIPLCHPLPISSAKVALDASPDGQGIDIRATVRTTGPTGVEMEALTAASVAALTLYDMCKAIDRGMSVERLRVIAKSGGRSGDWSAP
ncbi:cyclic pyranopterin phosphate synthase [Endobacter medicaginis]|uniref:Cyclic pyranopterin monophosphate synthase n=1 Tax=Endobacter medicaginis TaxID=1181271 RepID=A0A850NKR0_9PROT|nr:cyclic pyranopterin monophosphate synthase MoaC [Endobacter medicaginis]MBB3172731.1 cyclic pyranopterin phosphate synthase [Endobacter medicaginis]MCX5474338.1 cyclic pyranopterin monophosphate synthase MoaC [Endobacter medicaginis]NVN30213.1 cyclic pyranopterin monophosphate synthase MoaC [Endobacter medicaginis]